MNHSKGILTAQGGEGHATDPERGRGSSSFAHPAFFVFLLFFFLGGGGGGGHFSEIHL